MLIQRHHKHVGALQFLQHLLTALVPLGLSDDSVTEGGAELLQDRGAQQKPLHSRWLLLEHFLDQVVQDIALTTTDLLQHRGRIGGAL